MIDRRHLLVGLAAAPASTALPCSALAAGSDPTARDIVQRAHAAAGGAAWMRPRTLSLSGSAIFYPQGVQADRVVIADYRMWRVYPDASADAHAANGMVRIDSRHADGSIHFQTAFDGVTTYDQRGPVPGAQASREWSENFGFGIIRFALNDGFTLDRLPDDGADGRPMYVVRVTDPAGGQTLFGVAQDDHAIVWLGFSTPRGWHERRYSDFYRNPGVNFVQPGRVRLFYDGVKQNEVLWSAYELNAELPASMFVLPDAGPPR